MITRAGVTAWPKLFQNLRASRATELLATFPAHVVNAWLGHTEEVAEAHYRLVTNQHYALACSAQCSAQCSALQPALHSPTVNDGQAATPARKIHEKTPANRVSADSAGVRGWAQVDSNY